MGNALVKRGQDSIMCNPKVQRTFWEGGNGLLFAGQSGLMILGLATYCGSLVFRREVGNVSFRT